MWNKLLRLCLYSNLLLVCIVVSLIFFPRQIRAEEQGIIVDGADYVSTTTTVYPSDLVNISSSVTPRMIMEYADFVGKFGLNKLNGLSNVSGEVSPRIALEYADSILSINPQKPSLDISIPPRIMVEYADFIAYTNLLFPQNLIELITPPQIGQPLIDPPQNRVMPNQNVTISVNITDPEHGVKNATLEYKINNATTWQTKTMIYNLTSNLYYTTIPGQPEGTLVQFRIIAYDNAENMAVEDNNGEYYAYTVHTIMPVNIYDPADPTQNSLKLNWTQAHEDIFVRYEIQFSTSPYETGTLFQTITNPSQTTYNVTGLLPSTTYYFVVRVIYIQDFFADSNKVNGTTLPTPVVLHSPSTQTCSSLLISWEPNTDPNFLRYEIYVSSKAGELGSVHATLDNQTKTDYNVTQLSPSTTHYFIVRVVNQQGLFSDSNQVSGQTLPTPVILYSPTVKTASSILLTWTRNTDSNFDRYEIYMSETPSATGSRVASIENQATTTYNVTGLLASKTYYFIVRVFNQQGLFSDSNRVEATTLEAQPPPGGATPTPSFPWIIIIVAFIIIVVTAIIVAVYSQRKQKRKIRPPSPAKPRPTRRDATQYYHVPPSAKTPSIKLPSGEIRCGNCGFVNDPNAQFCKNCNQKL
jgi:fibronectin type 3 domain-containing protein